MSDSNRSSKVPQLIALAVLGVLTAWIAVAARPQDDPNATAIERARPAPDPGDRPRIDVAFVLDTTGSMAGLIEGAWHREMVQSG